MATKTMTVEIADADEAKYRPQINAMIAEIDQILKRMQRKQVKIDKLRTRTRSRLTELKALAR